MKKIILLLLLCVVTFGGYADTYTPPFPLVKGPIIPGSDGDEDDETEHRAPARPIFCSIDFNSSDVQISGYDSSEILSYEIWDAEGGLCITSTPDCTDFLSQLSQINGTVLVVFYFDGFDLSGYFSR